MVTLKSPDASNVTREFWEATKDEQLLIPYCNECEDYFFYPRRRCPICTSPDVEYKEANGRGTLVTHTTIYRAPTKNYQEMAPYVNALIDLEEGVRLMGNIDVESEEDLTMGMPVEVTFFKTESEYKLPFFTPTDDD